MVFDDLYRALWRQRRLIIGGTLLCVVVAVVFTQTRPKIYEATAVVRVEPAGEDEGANARFQASQQLARSYAEIYERGAVRSQMETNAPSLAPIDPDTALRAEQVKDLDLLAVSGRDEDPQRALLLAATGWRALETFSNAETLALVTAPELPEEPASPRTLLNIALGLFAGFILSAGAALGLHAIRRPVADVDAAERDLGVPVLATMPRLTFARFQARVVAGDASPPDADLAGVNAVRAVDTPARPSRRRSKP